MNTQNIYLPSKPHFILLDGLRGIASIIVLLYHLLEAYYLGSINQPLKHGYMAVDFFYVLSGFVISYSYDDRWEKMTFKDFIKRRLIRLHPMVIFSTFLGTLLFYFQSSETFNLINETSLLKLLLVMLWCFTLIPLPTKFDIRGWKETNPLNSPIWTLQWEYFGNIFYALIIRRLNIFFLCILTFFSSILIILITFNIDLLHIFNDRSDYLKYTILGGWCLLKGHIQIGLSRLLYSLSIGILISRKKMLIKLKYGFFFSFFFLVLLLFMPWVGNDKILWTNGLYETIVILVLFPLIVSIAAGSEINKDSFLFKINKFLGDISYPLYMVHYPLIYLQYSWVDNHKNIKLSWEIHFFVAFNVFFMAILIAYSSLKLYDEPIRKWLSSKLFNREKKYINLKNEETKTKE